MRYIKNLYLPGLCLGFSCSDTLSETNIHSLQSHVIIDLLFTYSGTRVLPGQKTERFTHPFYHLGYIHMNIIYFSSSRPFVK